MTQTVTIREVNQHTSAVFQRVREGEELIITRAGQPQARIVPFRPHDNYEEMVTDGRIVPAATHSFRPAHTIVWSENVNAALDAERAERD